MFPSLIPPLWSLLCSQNNPERNSSKCWSFSMKKVFHPIDRSSHAFLDTCRKHPNVCFDFHSWIVTPIVWHSQLSYLIEGGRECREIMPESWWSQCTSQHLRADWKVWKMDCGVEQGGLRNRWWKLSDSCLASFEWPYGFPLCSLSRANLTECRCGKRCSSLPISLFFWLDQSFFPS